MVIMTIVDFIFIAAAMFGGWFLRHCVPEEPDGGIGIRTRHAAANPAAWRYANRTCGALWQVFGWIGLALTVLNIAVLDWGVPGAAAVLIVTVTGMTGSVGWTELQLMKHEDERSTANSDTEGTHIT
jgi:hypothetical protein